MMRWLFVLLLLLPLGAKAATGVATEMTVTSPQGTTQALGNWMAGWNVIYPTNTSADVTAIQNAVNGSQPVLLAPGSWQVCSQISMPPNQRIEGFYTQSNPGSNGPSTANSKTIVSCPNNGSFTSGQAFFALQDHDQVRGLDIYCNYGASPTFNNINALNAVGVEIDHNNLYWCKEGVDRFSNGSIPGHSAAYSQLARVHDNLFYGQIDHGIRGDFSNGGFVSDEMYGPNNDFVVIRNAAAIYLNFVAASQIVGNRLEDATLGIDLENSGEITVTGNMCDQIGCIKLLSDSNVTVVGNVGHIGGFGGTTDVEFAGSNAVQFSGNNWGDSPIYTADGGATLTPASTINEQPANPNTTSTLFANTYTQLVVQPLMGINKAALTNTISSLSSSPNPGNHLSSRGFSPSVSSCGTGSPSVAGDDSAGTITTGTGSPTACTLTFGVAYTVIPQCTVTTSSTSSVPDISAISTTAFTVSLSATAAKLYYHCVEQVPSLLAGPVSMTSGWGASDATFTNAAGTDPLGGSAASKITEDGTATAKHGVAQNLTEAAGTYTMSAYIHAGTAGSDNVALVIFDSGFTNNAGAVFNPSDGTFVGTTLMAGQGSVTSVGSQAVGNGFFRVWMTFTLGSAQPVWEILYLAQGTTTVFNGNSTNNALVWGPAMRAGSLP